MPRNPGGLQMGHDDATMLVAAYVVGAIDADERASFEMHLLTCVSCRDEVAVMERVTIGFVEADAAAPPAALRDRILANATTVRPARAKLCAADVVSLPLPGRRRTPPPVPVSPHPGWLALAALLVASVGLAVYAVSLRSQLDQAGRTIGQYATRVDTLRDQLASERLNAARLVNVLRAPDAIKVDLSGRDAAKAATGRAYISASRGMVFEAEQMPILPAGKIYQLWIVAAGQGTLPVSAGIFNVAANGTFSMTVPLPAGTTSARVVAVTIEDGPNGVAQSKNSPVLLGESPKQ